MPDSLPRRSPRESKRAKAWLCLVTDRRRLAATLQRPLEEAADLLLAQLAGAIRGGIDLIQIREHDLESGMLVALLRSAVELARGTTTRVVVNDRLDCALVAGTAGVHLRERSVSVEAARRLLGPGALIGRSVHSAAAAATAGAVDYLIAGTVFASPSKDAGVCLLGLTGLAEVVEHAGGRPVLAIGGITRAVLPSALGCGAAGLAAIGAFLPPRGSTDIAAATEKAVAELRFTFDSSSSVP